MKTAIFEKRLNIQIIFLISLHSISIQINVILHCVPKNNISHLTYLVQLLYLGKLSRHKHHEFSLKLLILTAKLSPYYFTYLLFNLRFIT